MINTFKPIFKVEKRLRGSNDWFSLHLVFRNEILLSFSFLGGGFTIGALIYDVMKKE